VTAVKQQRLMKKVENHLRSVARKLINFDTEKETLQFLINSFRSQFPCDFAGIMLLEGVQACGESDERRKRCLYGPDARSCGRQHEPSPV